jgi:hypothetical protein
MNDNRWSTWKCSALEIATVRAFAVRRVSVASVDAGVPSVGARGAGRG